MREGEVAGAAMGGGVLRLRTSTSNSCRIETRRGQGGAPGRGREVRREEGARGSPSLADFTGDARRDCGVRRSIPSIRRRLEQEEERESTEDIWGLL
jgi:hypothetical protein